MAPRMPQGGALVPIVPDQDPFKPRWTARSAPPQCDPSLPPGTVTRSATAPRVGRAAQLVHVTVNAADRSIGDFGQRLTRAARYIGREGDGRSAPFDRSGTVKDTQKAVEAWKQDGRFYTISLNPQNGNALRDFRA